MLAQLVREQPSRAESLLDAGALAGVISRLSSPECRCLATDTLGAMLATHPGLQAFSERTPLHQVLHDGIQADSKEVRVATLHAFSQALEHTEKSATDRLERLARTMEDAGTNVAQLVMEQVTIPDPALVEAAWALMATLTRHTWGSSFATSVPGFCEQLLDRAQETTKACKEWKYDAACNVVGHADVMKGIPGDLQARLWRFKDDGPFAPRDAIPAVGIVSKGETRAMA